MPRFGLQLVLPEDQDQVEYIGYGPTESYQDKHRACWVDRFTTTVDELLEDYVKPQENGSHYHCAFVKVGELKAEGISEVHYIGNLEKKLDFIPGFVTTPWMISGMGIIYGKK